MSVEINKDTIQYKDILGGVPSLCIVKPVADKLVEADKLVDKQKTLIEEQKTLIAELKTQVAALKFEIVTKDNRHLEYKKYVEDLVALNTLYKNKEENRWSRSTYFILGDVLGVLKSVAAGVIWNLLK